MTTPSSPPRVLGEGDPHAKVFILGDAPSKNDEDACRPFIGTAGLELTRILQEAGILRTECYLTNVSKERPPWSDLSNWVSTKKNPLPNSVACNGRLVDPRFAAGLKETYEEINRIKPNIILTLGDEALHAVTQFDSCDKWRGSTLESLPIHGERYKVIPTYHPSDILRQWHWRWIALADVRRVAAELGTREITRRLERYIIRPDTSQTLAALEALRGSGLPVSVDIETSRGQIDCISFAWSEVDAICIPLRQRQFPYSYFSSTEEEFEVVQAIRQVLSTCPVIGQNWAYDQQYIARQWGVIVNLQMDTMITHHVYFPGLPKALDFLASLYCKNYVFWKDEGKEVNESVPEEQRWIYNCKDSTYTWECAQVLQSVREQMNYRTTSYGHPQDIQHALFLPILGAMLRGVKINEKERPRLAFDLSEQAAVRQVWLNDIIGKPINVNSPKQLKEFFYDDLGCKVHTNRKTKKPTTDSDALDKIAASDPLLRPLCAAINQIRQLNNFRAFCLQPLDHDGRIRCSYSIAGTETYRFSSSKDAFGLGTNLQNVSSGAEQSAEFPLPNLRKLFIPDEGYEFGEFDGAQADARVVAWEANDESLMELFLDPTRDLHNENTAAIFGVCRGKDDPHRAHAKAGVHLTNYGGTPPVLAAALGITIHEADLFQRRWFSAHPAIRDWHDRILSQLQARRYVENVFGYRRFYFDRIETVLKEALAWIPQSTVAIAINLGILNTLKKYSSDDVQFLLQVHDSAAFQWPKWKTERLFPLIQESMQIEIPYPRPLILPVGGKKSTKSWGDCK